jgi:hypothetical protein
MSEIEKVPAETKWALSTRIHTGAVVAMNTAIGEMLGSEKGREFVYNIWKSGGGMIFQSVKDALNIPVDDLEGITNLHDVCAYLTAGPELNFEIVESTPTKVVVRAPKCGWWERYQDFNVKSELRNCPEGHQAWGESGLKAINPKLTYKVTKAMPRGDPYCEMVIELK